MQQNDWHMKKNTLHDFQGMQKGAALEFVIYSSYAKGTFLEEILLALR